MHCTEDEFDEMSTRERLAEALRDENGLRPTGAALDVLMAAYEACNEVDGLHAQQFRPASPKPEAYAARVIKWLAFFQ